jgi:hypothetical protein
MVEARHLGVSFDDRFKLGVTRDLIQACKTFGSPLFHHVDDTLWTANTVVLHNLGRHPETLGLICLECSHHIFRLGQEWRHATRVEDRLTRSVRADRIHGMRGIAQQRHPAE